MNIKTVALVFGLTACGGSKPHPAVRGATPWTSKTTNLMIEQPDTEIKVTERHGYFEVTEPMHGSQWPENFTLNIALLDLKPLSAAEGIANMQTNLTGNGWTVKTPPAAGEFLGLKGQSMWLEMPSQKLTAEVFVATTENDHCMLTYLATGTPAYLEENHRRIKLDPALMQNGNYFQARACTKDLPVQY